MSLIIQNTMLRMFFQKNEVSIYLFDMSSLNIYIFIMIPKSLQRELTYKSNEESNTFLLGLFIINGC